jgi:hypothetical protein
MVYGDRGSVPGIRERGGGMPRTAHDQHRTAVQDAESALQRVVAALGELEAENAPPADADVHRYRNGDLDERSGVRHAVNTIRTAIEGDA